MEIVAKQSLDFLCLVLICTFCFTGCTVANDEGVKTSLDSNIIISNGTTAPSGTTDTTWCIAKPSSDPDRLQLGIDECCKHPEVDCSVISPDGCCFQPWNIYSHASVVMNLYYKAFGKNYWNCDFAGTGLIITQDPSYGPCVYPA